jgi:transcription elongation GreA/GreB family factor
VGNGIVAANDWAATYRRLKAAAEADPRIDNARAFEQTYRLAPPDAAGAAAEVPLPALEPRKPVRANLATLRKFLAQHPAAEAALAKRFGRYVERAMLDESGDPADRARAGLYLSRWFPERAAPWPGVLKALWERGLAVSDLSGEDEQIALLEASHAAGVEADAILSGLDSRFTSVRERAEALRARLDASGRLGLRRTLLDHAPRYPQAALRLIEEELARPAPSGAGAANEAWRLLWAALALIEERPKPSTVEAVLAWIAAGGPFERRLGASARTEEDRLRLTVLLRQWRSSDRYLFPALELADRVGLGEVAAAVRAAREAGARKLFDQVGRPAEVELPVMTRATWERLRQELERMERELRTEIPRTIQRARELGDLRENAEYQSAKLKQATLGKQVAALQRRLAEARFVEDVAHQEGVAGPGTEVVVEGEGGTATFWILGEDEHHHGPHVVSFQAPVGRALSGKRIGDGVVIEGRVHRVVAVERKLPPIEPHAAGAENVAGA